MSKTFMKAIRTLTSLRVSQKTNQVSPVEEKYELTSIELGSGAYASVILGKQLDTNESVAIKRISKEGLKHRDMQKIHKEVRILSSLSHKNIVKILDSYEDEKHFYMVMEYIPGGELFAKIVEDDNKMTEEYARGVIQTLLTALKYCKDNGVVHRDIKPENILLTADEDVKLADFNLAKQVDKDTINFDILETMCGTPTYVAPEIIEGNPYGYKCDIWSLGIIAFLLLSGGYLPFHVKEKDGPKAKEKLLLKIVSGRWSFLPERAWVNVSDQAKNFLTKMLVKDPEARYDYEMLLAHPWMKAQSAMLQRKIETKRLLDFSSARKMREVAAIASVGKVLKTIMNDDHPIGTSFKKAQPQSSSIVPASGEDFFNTLEDDAI